MTFHFNSRKKNEITMATILYYEHIGNTGNHCLSMDFLAD